MLITTFFLKKRPFTSGKSQNEISSLALNQLAIELQFSRLKLSGRQELVIISEGPRKVALKNFYEI